MPDLPRMLVYDPSTDVDASVSPDGDLVVTFDGEEVTTKGIKYTLSMEYDGGSNLVYLGKALPGASKASAVWQIIKLTYDGSGNPTDIQWADGNENFDNIWDNRASLSYS